ncbi:MAG: hypothetical protein ABF630_09525 [Liquorilactobacillus sp.]|jgi:hypothetical protein
MNWYYEYDKVTGAYVRMVRAAEQPQNTTATAPEELINPVFDVSTGSWGGESQAAWFEEQKKASAAQNSVPSDDQQTQASLVLQIAALQKSQETQAALNANLLLQIGQLQKAGN